MKFETPKMDINVFSENVLTEASGIENLQRVQDIKNHLVNNESIEDANHILTFTFD